MHEGVYSAIVYVSLLRDGDIRPGVVAVYDWGAIDFQVDFTCLFAVTIKGVIIEGTDWVTVSSVFPYQ